MPKFKMVKVFESNGALFTTNGGWVIWAKRLRRSPWPAASGRACQAVGGWWDALRYVDGGGGVGPWGAAAAAAACHPARCYMSSRWLLPPPVLEFRCRAPLLLP
jgi:hypothetical protein